MAGDTLNSPPLRILSLDGGGVKGFTSLLLLQSIFQSIESQTGQQVHPYEYFDLIAGTSTGGLIAILLGRLRMSIEDSIDAYKVLSPKIFKKKWWSDMSLLKVLGSEMNRTWFQGRNLQDAVCSLLSDKGLDPETRLVESEDPHCKVFVYAVDAHSSNVRLLRSYKSTTPGQVKYDCSLWEAARAATAAPLFFEPITFQKGDFTFVDGAVRANNPVEEAMNEARSLWPGREVACLVSLGTAISVQRGFHPSKTRLHAVLASLAKIATDANAKHIAFQNGGQGRELSRQQRYFRFSVAQGPSGIEMSDFEKLPLMQSMTIQYTTEVSREIEECARRLFLGHGDTNSKSAILSFVQKHGTGQVDYLDKATAGDLDLTEPEHVARLHGGTAIIVRIALILSAYNQVLHVEKPPTGRPRAVSLLREQLLTQRTLFQTQCHLLLSSALLQDDTTILHNFVFSIDREATQMLQGFQCTDKHIISLTCMARASDIQKTLSHYEDQMTKLRTEFREGNIGVAKSLIPGIHGRNLELHTIVLAGNKLSTLGKTIFQPDDVTVTEAKLAEVRNANMASKELQAACQSLWSCQRHSSHSANIKLSTRSKSVSVEDGLLFELVVTDSEPKSCEEPICLEVDCVRDTEGKFTERLSKYSPNSYGYSLPRENSHAIRLQGRHGEGSAAPKERRVVFEDETPSFQPTQQQQQPSTTNPSTSSIGPLCAFVSSALDSGGVGMPGAVIEAVDPATFSLRLRRLDKSGTRIHTLHSLPCPWRVQNVGSIPFANKVEKMKLAVALADMVLTHHSTPWLEEGQFSSGNVSFWDPTSSQRSLETPFLCYQHNLQSGSNAAKGKLQNLDPRAKNMTLFALGIMLLELEFEMSIEPLVERAGTQSQDGAHPADGFQAVRDLAGTEMGTVYGRIVRICLDCDFGLGLREYSMKDVMLQRRYYIQVISEFEKLLPRWQKIYE
ncbi:acyl transferase/acyl hydrolase/lysophospholipase [Rhypophila decipiens]|uniref:Acyl transferase/acyl hydrolase/lysophospholipase n=1 Tax=Rhypophila decipiens TaxID=261697 RepID=A0AAN6XWK6_9PEZI|nr:acyl transferase/acyl hydrolase/lysophospholipase [Rhypophila decipiens]